MNMNTSLIVSIVRKGWGSTALQAAVKAGARGGTVLFGRGAGIHEQEMDGHDRRVDQHGDEERGDDAGEDLLGQRCRRLQVVADLEQAVGSEGLVPARLARGEGGEQQRKDDAS